MEPQENKFESVRLPIFILFIFIICVIIPIAILVYYRFYITGFNYNDFKMAPISHKADDWSAFGSLMAGIFTLSSAVATFSTLVFLFFQNKKLNNDAKQTAKKNHEFMAFQLEKMSMEKFKLHHDMFSDMIGKIESEQALKYSFYSKAGLYKDIFPSNNFKSCSVTTINSANEPNSSLLEVLNMLKIMDDKLKDKTYEKEGGQLWNDIEALKQLLSVFPMRSPTPGDIFSIGGISPLNIPNVYLELLFLQNAISNICFFCNADFKYDNFSFQLSVFAIKALTEFAMKIETEYCERPGYPLRFLPDEKLCNLVTLYNQIHKLIPASLAEIYTQVMFEILSPLSPQRISNINGLSFDSHCSHVISMLQQISNMNSDTSHYEEMVSILKKSVEIIHEIIHGNIKKSRTLNR